MDALVFEDLSGNKQPARIRGRKHRRPNSKSHRQSNVLDVIGAILDLVCEQNSLIDQSFDASDERYVFLAGANDKIEDCATLTDYIKAVSNYGWDRTLWPILLCSLDRLGRCAKPLYLTPKSAHRLVMAAFDFAGSIISRMRRTQLTSPLEDSDLCAPLRKAFVSLLATSCECGVDKPADSLYNYFVATPDAVERPGVLNVGRQLDQILRHFRLRTLFDSNDSGGSALRTATQVLPKMWSLSPGTAATTTPTSVAIVAPPIVPPNSCALSSMRETLSWGSQETPSSPHSAASVSRCPSVPMLPSPVNMWQAADGTSPVVHTGSARHASFVSTSTTESPGPASSESGVVLNLRHKVWSASRSSPRRFCPSTTSASSHFATSGGTQSCPDSPMAGESLDNSHTVFRRRHTAEVKSACSDDPEPCCRQSSISPSDLSTATSHHSNSPPHPPANSPASTGSPHHALVRQTSNCALPHCDSLPHPPPLSQCARVSSRQRLYMSNSQQMLLVPRPPQPSSA